MTESNCKPNTGYMSNSYQLTNVLQSKDELRRKFGKALK